MSVIGTVNQQPNDVLDWDIDVSALVDGGDAIASVVATVTPATGLTVAPIETDDATVKLWIGPGTAGSYKIDVKVTTDNGRVKEDEIRVKVKEI